MTFPSVACASRQELHSDDDTGRSHAAQGNTLGARLVLLSLHFPRLRLLWSRSLHATADLFKALKSNQDEPDAGTAAAVGARSFSAALGSWHAPCTLAGHLAGRRMQAGPCHACRPLHTSARMCGVK